jgi:ABC-type protease/lipase transport system fused ATPase/permease subunit
VLDEPNANLDNEGEAALQTAIGTLKARGAIVIVIAHRPAVLEQCDKILVLANGAQQGFGPRDAILRKPPVVRQQQGATASGNVAVLRHPSEDASA